MWVNPVWVWAVGLLVVCRLKLKAERDIYKVDFFFFFVFFFFNAHSTTKLTSGWAGNRSWCCHIITRMLIHSHCNIYSKRNKYDDCGDIDWFWVCCLWSVFSSWYLIVLFQAGTTVSLGCIDLLALVYFCMYISTVLCVCVCVLFDTSKLFCECVPVIDTMIVWYLSAVFLCIHVQGSQWQKAKIPENKGGPGACPSPSLHCFKT